MAQEPNNQMDDLLKGYAKQRRQQADEPFEMHPATRQMLQGEVSRTLGKRAAVPEPRGRWLGVWWPRLAFGGAGVAIIAVAAVVLMQQPGRKPEPQHGDAYAVLTPAAAPAESDRKLDEMLAAKRQTAMAKAAPAPEAERVAGGTLSKLEAAKKLEKVGEAAAAVPPPPAKPSAAVAVVTAPPTATAGVYTGGMTVSGGVMEVAAVPAAPAPAEPAPAGRAGRFRTITAGVENMARASQRMRFAQVASTRDAEAKDQSAAQQQVLASFQLDQSGDRVVIVDADGSTYEGQVQLEQAAPLQQNVELGRRVTLTKKAPAPTPTESPAKEQSEIARAVPQKGTAITRGEPAQAAAWQEQQQQQLFFTAAGTNRSLRQRVVINGTLNLAGVVAGSNAAVAGQPAMLGVAGVVSSNAPASAAAAPAAPAFSQQSPARVQGTFRVGDAPAVRLDAVGVGP